jgi:predicted DsbA family dithiol-disulfide isomerase
MSETLSNIVRSSDRVAITAALHVEVIADFVCPFCFIGKRHLDEALKAVQGPYEVSWNPFQLNPEIPPEGLPFDIYLTKRFGRPKKGRRLVFSSVLTGSGMCPTRFRYTS